MCVNNANPSSAPNLGDHDNDVLRILILEGWVMDVVRPAADSRSSCSSTSYGVEVNTPSDATARMLFCSATWYLHLLQLQDVNE